MLSPNVPINTTKVNISSIKEILENNSLEQLNLLFEDKRFEDILKNELNIISHVSEHLTKEVYSTRNCFFLFCEKILYKIAELRDPDDTLFDLIEQAEDADEIKFNVVLKALKITLLKYSLKKRYYSLNWCYQAIVQFIKNMPPIEDYKLEGDEVILQESSKTSKDIEKVYEDVIHFCEPFIDGISELKLIHPGDHEEFKCITLVFIFKLFGRPLVYMNLERKDPTVGGRIIAEKLLKYVANFKVDFMSFLNFVKPYKTHNTEKTSSDFLENDYSNISLGVFYLLVFQENEHLDMISQVYHPHFILDMIIIITLEMLKLEDTRVKYKALLLCGIVLFKIGDQSLNFFGRNNYSYGKLFEVLAKIMVFADVKEIRQFALKIFKELFFKFDNPSRYHILFSLPNVIPQPGFVGFIITLVKDFIVKVFIEKEFNDYQYFTKAKCVVIIKRFCKLPDKEKSDLIELSDQIISTLNLLRFILIRDKDNSTGIFEYISQLENDFLEPLQSGLQLSIAHYKLQQKELQLSHESEKLSVKVAGEVLPNLPLEQKKYVLNVALTTFDLIESLLVRVKECIEEFKVSNAI